MVGKKQIAACIRVLLQPQFIANGFRIHCSIWWIPSWASLIVFSIRFARSSSLFSSSWSFRSSSSSRRSSKANSELTWVCKEDKLLTEATWRRGTVLIDCKSILNTLLMFWGFAYLWVDERLPLDEADREELREGEFESLCRCRGGCAGSPGSSPCSSSSCRRRREPFDENALAIYSECIQFQFVPTYALPGGFHWTEIEVMYFGKNVLILLRFSISSASHLTDQ